MSAAGRLFYSSLFDDATITSSSEASTSLVDDNVVSHFVGKKWRTTGDSAEWIKFDLGSAKAITGIGLFGLNLTSSATVVLEGHASDSWGSPSFQQTLEVVVDSNSVAYPKIVEFLSETYRWWRITIADATNSDGYIEIGRVYAGAFYEFTSNFVDSVNRELIDPSKVSVTVGNQPYVVKKTPFWRYSVSFNYMSRTQTDKLEAIFRTAGKGASFVFCIDPTDYPTKDSIYCRLNSDLVFSHVKKIGSTVLTNLNTLSFEEIG